MAVNGECGQWKAIKAGEEVLVYGLCTFRSGTWRVSLEDDNPGVALDPATMKLRTNRTGGGATQAMSYLLPNVKRDGSSLITKVIVDGETAELEDWTPRPTR